MNNCTTSPLTDRLTAARLAARLERAGVDLVVRAGLGEGLDALRATGSPVALDAFVDARTRSEIARLKPALLEVLDPLQRPIGARAAQLILAREDSAWTQLTTGLARCALCGAGCSHLAPDGRPRHPWCFDHDAHEAAPTADPLDLALSLDPLVEVIP